MACGKRRVCIEMCTDKCETLHKWNYIHCIYRKSWITQNFTKVRILHGRQPILYKTSLLWNCVWGLSHAVIIATIFYWSLAKWVIYKCIFDILQPQVKMHILVFTPSIKTAVSKKNTLSVSTCHILYFKKCFPTRLVHCQLTTSYTCECWSGVNFKACLIIC